MKKNMSPCVRNCCLNENNICLGCFRSIDEICQWSAACEQERRVILKLAEKRKAILMSNEVGVVS